MKRPSDRLASIIEYLAIGILLVVAAAVAYGQYGPIAIDSSQSILSCKPWTDPFTKKTMNSAEYKLLVERKSDGKIILLDFCAAAEDSRYASVKPGQRLPAKK